MSFYGAIRPLALVPLLLGGCSSVAPRPQPPPKPCATYPLELFLQGEPRLNLNELGQPMPVEVRAYLLKDRRAFDMLDFETLWRQGDKRLGTDLLGQPASVTVFPGKVQIHTMSCPGTAVHLALVGLFRKPEGSTWKLVFDLTPPTGSCGPDQLHTVVQASLRRSSLAKEMGAMEPEPEGKESP